MRYFLLTLAFVAACSANSDGMAPGTKGLQDATTSTSVATGTSTGTERPTPQPDSGVPDTLIAPTPDTQPALQPDTQRPDTLTADTLVNKPDTQERKDTQTPDTQSPDTQVTNPDPLPDSGALEPDTKTVICGRLNGPCCANSTCNTSLLTCVENVCAAAPKDSGVPLDTQTPDTIVWPDAQRRPDVEPDTYVPCGAPGQRCCLTKEEELNLRKEMENRGASPDYVNTSVGQANCPRGADIYDTSIYRCLGQERTCTKI